MKLINLTPHPFKIVNSNQEVILELPSCENPPRAAEEREQVDTISNVPVNKLSLGQVSNLPDPQKNTAYIVSRITAEACPERDDLYIPDGLVRDEKGQIIGCKALAKV